MLISPEVTRKGHPPTTGLIAEDSFSVKRSIGRRPNMIAASESAALSLIEYVEQKAGQEQIGDENGHGGIHESHNRSAAHARCTTLDAQAAITPHCRHDKSENNRLAEADNQVAERQGLNGTCPEFLRINVQRETCHQESAEQARGMPNGHEQRQALPR